MFSTARGCESVVAVAVIVQLVSGNIDASLWPICRQDGALMRVGMLTDAEDMERLRQVNAHNERIPVTMPWLIAEASRPLAGLEHAVQGGVSDAIVLKDMGGVGHLCQMITERYVMPC